MAPRFTPDAPLCHSSERFPPGAACAECDPPKPPHRATAPPPARRGCQRRWRTPVGAPVPARVRDTGLARSTGCSGCLLSEFLIFGIDMQAARGFHKMLADPTALTV